MENIHKSDNKQGFIVQINIEIGVYAEDSDEAENLALENIQEECELDNSCITIIPLTRLPRGWRSNCLLYNNDNEEVSVNSCLCKEYKKEE